MLCYRYASGKKRCKHNAFMNTCKTVTGTINLQNSMQNELASYRKIHRAREKEWESKASDRHRATWIEYACRARRRKKTTQLNLHHRNKRKCRQTPCELFFLRCCVYINLAQLVVSGLYKRTRRAWFTIFA